MPTTKVEIELQGFQEAKRHLAALPNRVQVKILRAAGRKALGPMRKAAQRNAPKESGALGKSIGILTEKDQNRSVGAVVLAPRKGRKFKYDGWYAHLLEGGHKIVRGKKTIGDSPAKPFMEPAIMAEKDAATEVYYQEVVNSLEKELLKFAKRR